MTRNGAGRAVGDVAIGLSVSVAFLLFLPNGPAGRWLLTRWHEAARRRTIRREWGNLIDGPRLDTGAVPVAIVEFADYECPACRADDPAVEEVVSRYSHVGIVYRDYPLTRLHPRAEAAAIAAQCAAEQGRFREMHNRLFGSGDWIADGDWIQEATAAGIPNLREFSRCLRRPGTRRKIRMQRTLGDRVGIRGTPTFVFADGGVHTGAMTMDQILERLGQRVGNGD